MTGILIYLLFSHSPASQANVQAFHSKPTLLASKLKHDISPRPRSLPELHLTPCKAPRKCAHLETRADARHWGELASCGWNVQLLKNSSTTSKSYKQKPYQHQKGLIWKITACWASIHAQKSPNVHYQLRHLTSLNLILYRIVLPSREVGWEERASPCGDSRSWSNRPSFPGREPPLLPAVGLLRSSSTG